MKKVIQSVLAGILLGCSTSMFAQGVDIVTLTTIGEGKTQSEAVSNALRSAIEQAFGTFISSNTTIVNDALIKDEIVSVASGNIQKYDILSSAALPNGNTAVSVKANVSVTKLTKFSEGKGISIEYKGDLFAANVKLMEVYKKNELKVLKNLRIMINEIVSNSNCFDYSISVKDPEKDRYDCRDCSGEWLLKHTISITPNKNFANVISLFLKTLTGISLSSEDIQNYEKIGESIYEVNVDRERFYLRSHSEELRKIQEIIYLYKFSCIVDNGLFTTIFKRDGLKFSIEYDKKYCQRIFVYKTWNDKTFDGDGNIDNYGRDVSEPFRISHNIMTTDNYFSFSSEHINNGITYNSCLSLADIEKIQKYSVEPYKASKGNPDEDYERAIELYHQEKYAESVEIFKKLLDQKYQEDIIRRNLGVIYLDTDKYAEAVEVLEKMKTHDVGSYYYLALAYHYLGNNDKAVEKYRAAAKLGHEQAIKILKDNNIPIEN